MFGWLKNDTPKYPFGYSDDDLTNYFLGEIKRYGVISLDTNTYMVNDRGAFPLDVICSVEGLHCGDLTILFYVDERIISARSQNPASLCTVEYYNKINKCWIAAMKQYLTQKDA